MNASAGRRILYVEDDVALATLVPRLLAGAGFEVVVESDPEGALLHAGSVDVVISDVQFGGSMAGPALVERLRAETPGLGVVFTSGHPVQVLVDAGVSLESAVFLAKPFRRAELIAAIEEATRPSG